VTTLEGTPLSTDPNFPAVCEMLRELQRDYREDPFFAELFKTRSAGFIAASSAIKPELMSDISVEQVEWSWVGLCEQLDVPSDTGVETLEDLLDLSDQYDA
jgi:hypothetical protein